MARRCSRSNRSNTNRCEEKQRYKELAEMIAEWSDLYYNKMGFLKIDKRQIYHKYKEIRRLLIKDFNNDIDLKKYIKSLPKPWVVYEWLMPVIFVVCTIGLAIANELFFEIYTGVTGEFRGGKVDGIYVFYSIAVAIIWILIGPKMDKRNILENNMRSIYGIAFRKS